MCVCGDAGCTIPEGYCHCGCGLAVYRAKRTRSGRGVTKGQFVRYLDGHLRSRFGYDVDPDTGCWVWTGCVDQLGYGRAFNGMAHRWVYERDRGPIAEGMSLDHLCRNRTCVNPDHLEPVSHLVNCRRGAQTKLRRCEVEEVKRYRRAGISRSRVAAMFKVSPQAVTAIMTQRTWKDVA